MYLLKNKNSRTKTVFSKNKIKHVFVHAFTDGRDTDPKAGKKYVSDFLGYAKDKNISIASVIGRYYSMDRDLDRTSWRKPSGAKLQRCVLLFRHEALKIHTE